MPTTALQMPYVRGPAVRESKRVFSTLILPLGVVEHPDHGRLEFTRERLQGIIDRFRAGAMDAVPYLLADRDNRHTDDPERTRGRIISLSLVKGGLQANIEPTSEKGEMLFSELPDLPRSVRLKVPDTGPFKGQEVLAHVLGTWDPVATGMGPGRFIDASDGTEVVDLTAGGVYSPLSMADTQTPEQGNGDTPEALSTEEVGRFRAFLQRFGNGDNPPAPEGNTVPPEADAALTELLNSLDTDPADEREPVAFSNENAETIELTKRVERAEVRAGTAELANRLSGYLDEGVPPTLINAAKAQLLGDSDEHKAIAIDFANGREPAAAKALFAVLDGAKGTIDFTEHGSSNTSTEDEGREAKLDAWEEHSG